MGKKRVWMYCRIAHQSAADNFSMAAQVESLKEYATHNNLSIVGISTEYGSGLTLDRPGLMEVKKAVQENETDAVLTRNLSRIARGFIHAQQAIHFLSKHKVELILADQGITP